MSYSANSVSLFFVLGNSRLKKLNAILEGMSRG